MKSNETEKKERIKEQNRQAVKKYSEKTMSFAVKYYPTDIIDGKRLKKHLEETKQSANAYMKQLIKKDLDNKGVEYNES